LRAELGQWHIPLGARPAFARGFSLERAPFFEFILPCLTPPIQSAGTYWFAAVLTQPGDFGNGLSELFVCQFQYEGG